MAAPVETMASAMISGLLVSRSLPLFLAHVLYLVFARIFLRRRERKAARLAAAQGQSLPAADMQS